MKLKDKFAAVKQEIQKLLDQSIVIAKELFTSASKSIFDAHPQLQSFGWAQYTPYFNDGDECVFGAHTDYITVSVDGDKDDEDQEVSSWLIENGNKHAFTPREKAAKDIFDLLDEFENKDFKALFGDHVEVTVTREGATVDAYEHD